MTVISKPLWKHQIATINMALDGRNELAIFHEAGTGKTRTIIEILRGLTARHGRLKTLIICPQIVQNQWRKQLLEYNNSLTDRDILVLTKSEKNRCLDFTKFVSTASGLELPKIIILNPNGLEMKKLISLIESWGPEVLVVDESHEFKGHGSVRAKVLMKIADKAAYRYIASGTPILNTESDIFMQYRILDRGVTFGTNYYAFRRVYYYDENSAWAHRQNHFPKYVCSDESKERIRGLMYSKAIRALKKDCLDLPPFVRKTVDVDMSAEQLRAYNEMKNDFITWLSVNSGDDKPKAVVAQLALTKAMKLQQIVSGFAITDTGETVRFTSVPRIKVLGELLSTLTLSNKVIVWANFVENYKMISELCIELGIKYAEVHGGQTAKEKFSAIEEFNLSEECRVMIANQGAGGVGVDMISASYAIYYSKDYSLNKDIQSEARNYRGGSHIHESITRIDLVTQETIDETITKALEQKMDLASFILDKDIL